VDVWTFIWLMVLLKIPIVGLFLIVRWAVRQEPEPAAEDSGGIGPRPHPRHPRPQLPRNPRRGPHRHAEALASPPRIRSVTARSRSLSQ